MSQIKAVFVVIAVMVAMLRSWDHDPVTAMVAFIVFVLLIYPSERKETRVMRLDNGDPVEAPDTHDLGVGYWFLCLLAGLYLAFLLVGAHFIGRLP